ncbi:ABC-2 transporter permease [Lancefieldella rimae]
MNSVLYKEMRLSASPVAYLFTLFGLMFLIPGYPVLCGALFSALGLFKSFEYAREANDPVFSALLPIAKRDVVRERYLFVCLIEGCTLALMAAADAGTKCA